MRDRVYRAEMGEPPMPDEGAPGPMTRRQRMDKLVIGKPGDLKPGDRRLLNPVLEPVDGEEEKPKKKMASGGYTKAADGCVQRGKTRGKMV